MRSWNCASSAACSARSSRRRWSPAAARRAFSSFEWARAGPDPRDSPDERCRVVPDAEPFLLGLGQSGARISWPKSACSRRVASASRSRFQCDQGRLRFLGLFQSGLEPGLSRLKRRQVGELLVRRGNLGAERLRLRAELRQLRVLHGLLRAFLVRLLGRHLRQQPLADRARSVGCRTAGIGPRRRASWSETTAHVSLCSTRRVGTKLLRAGLEGGGLLAHVRSLLAACFALSLSLQQVVHRAFQAAQTRWRGVHPRRSFVPARRRGRPGAAAPTPTSGARASSFFSSSALHSLSFNADWSCSSSFFCRQRASSSAAWPASIRSRSARTVSQPAIWAWLAAICWSRRARSFCRRASRV